MTTATRTITMTTETGTEMTLTCRFSAYRNSSGEPMLTGERIIAVNGRLFEGYFKMVSEMPEAHRAELVENGFFAIFDGKIALSEASYKKMQAAIDECLGEVKSDAEYIQWQKEYDEKMSNAIAIDNEYTDHYRKVTGAMTMNGKTY